MPNADFDDSQGWACTWEDARRRTLTLGAEATPAQRIAWLEEAILLAHRSGALPKRRTTRSGGYAVVELTEGDPGR